MGANQEPALISVKRSLLRHPAVIGAGGASLAALLGLNAVAFARGLDSPWLLGGAGLAAALTFLVVRFSKAFDRRRAEIAASRSELRGEAGELAKAVSPPRDS